MGRGLKAGDEEGQRREWRRPTKVRTWARDGVPLRIWRRMWKTKPIQLRRVRHTCRDLAPLAFGEYTSAVDAVSSAIGERERERTENGENAIR